MERGGVRDFLTSFSIGKHISLLKASFSILSNTVAPPIRSSSPWNALPVDEEGVADIRFFRDRSSLRLRCFAITVSFASEYSSEKYDFGNQLKCRCSMTASQGSTLSARSISFLLQVDYELTELRTSRYNNMNLAFS